MKTGNRGVERFEAVLTESLTMRCAILLPRCTQSIRTIGRSTCCAVYTYQWKSRRFEKISFERYHQHTTSSLQWRRFAKILAWIAAMLRFGTKVDDASGYAIQELKGKHSNTFEKVGGTRLACQCHGRLRIKI